MLFSATLMLLGSAFANETANPTETVLKGTVVDRVENGAIYFKVFQDKLDPPPLKTTLQELEYIDTVESGGSKDLPYFVLKGRSSSNSDTDPSIYIVRADGQHLTSFVHPGEIRESGSNQILYDGRAFVGECLPARGPVYVVFQREKIDRWRYLQRSVLIAELKPNGIQEKLIVRRRPDIQQSLRRVKKKECQEIQGWNRSIAKSRLPRIPKKK